MDHARVLFNYSGRPIIKCERERNDAVYSLYVSVVISA
jgi:hypothetical protein